jgi:hypothetical protein
VQSPEIISNVPFAAVDCGSAASRWRIEVCAGVSLGDGAIFVARRDSGSSRLPWPNAEMLWRPATKTWSSVSDAEPTPKRRTAVSPDRIDPDNRYSRQVETRSRRSRVAAVSQSRVFRRRRKSFEHQVLRHPVTLVTLVTMNRGPFRARRAGRRHTGFRDQNMPRIENVLIWRSLRRVWYQVKGGLPLCKAASFSDRETCARCVLPGLIVSPCEWNPWGNHDRVRPVSEPVGPGARRERTRRADRNLPGKAVDCSTLEAVRVSDRGHVRLVEEAWFSHLMIR